MKDGQAVSTDELCSLAREAWEGTGKTQTEAAKELGVQQPTFAQAINEPKRSLTQLRILIIEKYTDFEVQRPEYRLTQKGTHE